MGPSSGHPILLAIGSTACASPRAELVRGFRPSSNADAGRELALSESRLAAIRFPCTCPEVTGQAPGGVAS